MLGCGRLLRSHDLVCASGGAFFCVCAELLFCFFCRNVLGPKFAERVFHAAHSDTMERGGGPARLLILFWLRERAAAVMGCARARGLRGRPPRVSGRRPGAAGPSRKRAADRKNTVLLCYKVLLREVPKGVAQERNPNIQHLTVCGQIRCTSR